jgi:hypothetical protein
MGLGLGDDSSAISPTGLPYYCSPFDDNYYQLPGVPGTNGVPDYATALATCAPASSGTIQGDILGVQSQVESQCAQQATADAQKFAGISSDLRTNWNPVGDDFAPDDLWKVVSQMLLLSSQANSQLEQPIGSIGTSDDQRAVIKMFTDALGDINTQSLNYKAAYNLAKQTNVAVHAPQLKAWVTSSLDTFAQAVYQGSKIACLAPWWAGALQTVFGIAQTLGAICKAVGSVALALGEKAVVAVEGAFDMVAVLEKIAPFAAIGLLAWWLFLREKKRGEKTFSL